MGAASRTPIQDFLLKQRGIVQVIVIGLLANTRIETTSRFAAELSYHATWSKTQPAAAHEILTTAQLIAALDAIELQKKRLNPIEEDLTRSLFLRGGQYGDGSVAGLLGTVVIHN